MKTLFTSAFLIGVLLLSNALQAQIKKAEAVSSTDGRVVLTWEFTNKAVPVDIYWGTSPDKMESTGKLIAKNLSEGTYAMYAPDAYVQAIHQPTVQQRIYYGIKPQTGKLVVTAERKVDRFDNISKMDNFKPVNNFRDVGGYLNKDGKQVKWGKFYRSNELANLSESEIAYVKHMEIATIFDLRKASEVNNYPDVNIGAEMVYFEKPLENTPSTAEKDPSIRLKSWARFAGSDGGTYEYMVNSNKGYVEQYKHIYKEMFQTLVNKKPGKAILGHCAGGKDRTGAIFAVLLFALDVPEETIMHDYLLTGVYRQKEDDIELHFVKKLNNLSDKDIEKIAPAWRVYPEYLNAFLNTVKEKYGSMDNYLKKECGLTDTMKAKLKALYLE